MGGDHWEIKEGCADILLTFYATDLPTPSSHHLPRCQAASLTRQHTLVPARSTLPPPRRAWPSACHQDLADPPGGPNKQPGFPPHPPA